MKDDATNLDRMLPLRVLLIYEDFGTGLRARHGIECAMDQTDLQLAWI